MAPPHIVVANHDPDYLELIQQLLKEEGYSRVTCIQASEVFPKIREAPPQLILLDITIMDAGQGWRTLDMLRLHPNTAKVPIIICSTDMRMLNEKAERLRRLHCDTLEKPFDLELLLEKIAAVVGPPPSA